MLFSTSMIKLEHIVIQISGKVLLDFDRLVIQQGQKVVLTGPSGSGKSCLLQSILGGVPLAAGSISVQGLELCPRNLAKIRARTSYIGQEPFLGTATVNEALLLPFTYNAHKKSRPSEQEIKTRMSCLGLSPELLAETCGTLSGGEKQRLAVVRALLLNNTLLLADEITSALDCDNKDTIIETVLGGALTVFSVSHDPDWIRACDRVVTITNQSLIEL